MSYGSGDNYSYDGSNQGGYTGYGEDSTPQYGYDNFNQGYDQVDGGVGNSNPFDNFAPVSGGADSGTPVSGGGVADSNPFGNFDAGEDIAGGFSNVSVGSGGGGGGGGGGFGDQYEVFGSGNNNQFDQGYSLTSEGTNEYSVASSHASPDVLAETMDLPVPSGQQSADVLGFPSQPYDTSSYGEGSKKKKKKKKKKYSWYELGYYKTLFDFDTDEIVRRLLSALNPLLYSKFWEETKSKPDLYVPVWGTVTLWFLLVACGTVASDLIADDCSSKVEFDKVGWGAFATFGYIFFPSLLWLVLFKFWVEIPMGLFDNVCVYGYSLLPYLPTMFIGIMPYTWIRWIPFGLSCALSSYFLVANYCNELKDHMKQGVIIMALMVLLNVGLCILYKMYFFETC